MNEVSNVSGSGVTCGHDLSDSTELALQPIAGDPERVTEADIRKLLAARTYTLLPSNRTVVCELTFTNGHLVHGVYTHHAGLPLDLPRMKAMANAAAMASAKQLVGFHNGYGPRQLTFDAQAPTGENKAIQER